MSRPPRSLPLTGERTMPGIAAENYWFRRHEVAYEFATPLVARCTVLEAGCGEGYGTALLARTARRVIGVDYDEITVAHAAATYPDAIFVRANLAALPLAAESVNAVATLQVIEHVWDHRQFVGECRRVLRPGGRLIVTTPNRLTFSPGRDTPLNPFHSKEFSAGELTELLDGNGFAVEAVHGVQAGPHLARLDRRYGSFVAVQLRTPPDDWPVELRADVAAVTTADFPVIAHGRRDVNGSLDLIVIGRRV